MKSKRPQLSGAAPDQDEVAGSDRTPLDWPRHTGRLNRVMEAIAVRKKRRRRRVQGLVGGISALVIAGFIWNQRQPEERIAPAPATFSRLVVSVPERRLLPDGSIVDLKEGSEIAVDFDGELRRVTLRRGEAHFKVASNPARAFVVDAGGMEFRAVGTAFAVQLNSSKVEMVVTEGRVAVERASTDTSEVPAPPPVTVVNAGSHVAVDLRETTVFSVPEVTPISAAESDEKLAWRVPRLKLSDTPLAEAIAAINQHSSFRLELGDAELGNVEISGVLRADNFDPLLRTLESNYGIRVDRRAPGTIVLRKASGPRSR